MFKVYSFKFDKTNIFLQFYNEKFGINLKVKKNDEWCNIVLVS